LAAVASARLLRNEKKGGVTRVMPPEANLSLDA
jgi:hypothetical protein